MSKAKRETEEQRAGRLASQKRWRDNNIFRVRSGQKDWRGRNPEKQSRRSREWKNKNPERQKANIKRWQTTRLATDPAYRLKCILRSRVYSSLRRALAKKLVSTITLLGCSAEQFRIHIESKFEPWMKWKNYGKRTALGFEIDHIKPLSAFDLADPEQQRKAFHYTNNQPLHWLKNRIKKDKYLL